MGSRGAGGTSGGIGTFFLGLIMSLAGGYMLTNMIVVSSNFLGQRYSFGGISVSSFSATLVLFLIGVGLVFFNASSKPGWALTAVSLFLMIMGVITNLNVYFTRTSLFTTLIVFGLLVGGLGLIARSLLATD